jgi:hypothetical protein
MIQTNTQPPQLDAKTVVLFSEWMQPYLEHFKGVVDELRKTNDAISRDRVISPWLDADETALVLGIKVLESGYHARTLSKLCDRGLMRFREGKPRMYWRTDVFKLAQDIADGKVDYL